ncbi:hypothetical protein SAMN05443549_102260 [Flavobacterium fluvii]|uniref:Uncharacterized protein n=1 Tax=Flavobacterium fluvii TaxID=468056 RepID=A0A1M5HJA7_9FLAO|nr:hypothetical protein SAMN05443549_102260 [Flavobacterium fluvii]
MRIVIELFPIFQVVFEVFKNHEKFWLWGYVTVLLKKKYVAS